MQPVEKKTRGFLTVRSRKSVRPELAEKRLPDSYSTRSSSPSQPYFIGNLQFNEIERIDEAVYSIIRNWYKLPSVEDALVYRCTNLGFVAEYYLSNLLPYKARKFFEVRRFISETDPEELEVSTRSDGLLMQLALDSLNRSCRIRYAGPPISGYAIRSGRTPRYSVKSKVRKALLRLERPTGHFMDLLLSRQFCSFRKQAKGCVALYNPSSTLLEAIPREWMRVIICKRSGWPYIFKLCTRHRVPYYALKTDINRLAGVTHGQALADLHELWDSLDTNGNFRSCFIVDQVDLWHLLRQDFKQLFEEEFIRYLRFVDDTHSMLADLKPSVILSIPGISHIERAIFSVARSEGIPTVMVQHGLLHEQRTQELLLADYAFVWGEAGMEWYVERRNANNRFFVTGNPQWTASRRRKHVYRRGIHRKLGLNPTRVLAVLATTVSDVSDFYSAHRCEAEGQMVCQCVFRALEDIPDMQMVIKLHPRENQDTYDLELSKQEAQVRRRVVIVRDTKLHELLNACDVLLTPGSTVAMEAMILDKPVIIVNATGRPESVPYVEWGAARRARDADELVAQLRAVLSNAQTDEGCAEKRRQFVAAFASPVGEEVFSENISQALLEIVKRQDSG